MSRFSPVLRCKGARFSGFAHTSKFPERFDVWTNLEITSKLELEKRKNQGFSFKINAYIVAP
jgi:hypothetical protein